MAVMTTVVLGIAGCGSSGGGPYEETPIPAPTESIALTEELSLGGEGGADDTAADADDLLFKAIGHVAVDEDENIYVVDWMDATVHVADSTGRPLRTIGSRGTGPGEFEYPSIVVLSGDSVIVFRQGGWLSAFDRATGTYRSQLELPGYAPYFISEIISFDGESFLFRLADDIPKDEAERARDRVVRVTVGPGSADAKTIDLAALPGRDLLISRNASGGIDRLASAPFGYRSTCAAAAGRVFCGWSGGNQFTILSPTGDSLGIVAVEFERLDVTPADRDPMVERYAGTGFAKDMHFNDLWPAFDSIVGDDRGRLWVKVRDTRDYTTTTLWVVDVEQRVTRSVTLAGNLVPSAVRNGKLYGRITRPDGEQNVVRYRIEE